MTTTSSFRVRRSARAAIGAGTLGIALLGGGCAFQRTAKEVRTAAKLGVIAGTVKPAPGADKTYVLLFAMPPKGKVEVTGVAELSELSDQWGFVCPEGEEFVLGAFRDVNGDGVRNPGEPAGYLGADTPLMLGAGVRLRDVTIDISPATKNDPRLPLDVTGDVGARRAALRFSMGEILTLDDQRFSDDNLSKGLWTPLTALRENGGGIYFLEPYDPNRVPVLFVHGIGGSPRDLRVPIEKLDRSRFQPWVFFYPSGFRLQTIANGLSRNLPRLREKLGFKTVYVVAHSMGGLVSRRAILDMDNDPKARDIVGLFVTVSSPLAGHSAVKWGLAMTPEPVPAWIDLDPDSAFIKALAHPLPDRVPYYMLFGFRRGSNMFMPSSSDSVVPVESELPMWAQRQAIRIWGFDEDHMKILTDDEAVAILLGILERTADAAGQTAPTAGAAPPR